MVPLRPPARAFLVTLADAGLILFAAAAVVVALGGRTRIDVAGMRVSFRGAANLFLLAAVCAVVRMAIGWRLRPLPILPPGDPGRVEAERRRLADPGPASRGVWICAGLALAGSLIWALPQLEHLRQVPDAGDPVFSAWRIAALAHQLSTDPRHLWDGNIFYPVPLTITYSDSLFLQSLLALPFLLAHVDPLVVANALMAVSYPARGLAFFYATWRITGDPQAALVASLVGAWSPFYPQHYSQLELNWSMFVPLAILALLRALADPRWKTGFLFGAALAGQCLACMYIAVMLVSGLVPFAIMMAVAWRVRPSARIARAVGGAALVLLPIIAMLGVPYMKGREAHGERSLKEVSDGSASPRDYGDAHIRLVAYQWQSGKYHHAERELFPGSSSLVLGTAGILPPLTPVAIATLVSGAFAFDWSLGLKGLTYDDLYRRSSVYRGLRVVARFSAMVDAALAFLCAFGAKRILARAQKPATRAVTCAALCLIVLVDLHMDPMLHPYPPDAPGIYGAVTPQMVLAEMPDGHVIDSMYFSTRHWARLLDGYSGYFPSAPDLDTAKREFPSPTSVAILRQRGATHVTYNCAWEARRGRCDNVLRELAANPSLELVARDLWQQAEVRLYRIK
jgi:hypothetical protein